MKEMEWFGKVEDKIHLLVNTLRPNYINKLEEDVTEDMANEQRAYMAKWLESLCKELEPLNDYKLTGLVERAILRGKSIAKEDGYKITSTYDNEDRELTHKNTKTGFWVEMSYDDNGDELSYKDSEGFIRVSTYDERGNRLTYEHGDYSWVATYDEKDRVLTHKNSDGVSHNYTYDNEGNASYECYGVNGDTK